MIYFFNLSVSMGPRLIFCKNILVVRTIKRIDFTGEEKLGEERGPTQAKYHKLAQI